MSVRAPRSRPLSVLLVEDNPADAQLTREALRECTAQVSLQHVTSTEAAWEQLSGQQALPDLVLVDLHLPRTDGRALLRRIKADDRLRRLPVVVLTTSTSPDDIVSCYESQAASYLVKPTSFGQLVALIDRFVAYWCDAVALPPPHP